MSTPIPPKRLPGRHDGAPLSSIGIGTYLGADTDEVDALYRESIARAISLGINVIDAAINYRSQRSERVIGEVLRSLIATDQLKRESVFVSSKAGYVPYDNQRPRHYPTYVEDTYIKPGILRKEELVNGVHCMAPRYLADQIERSRNNLGLDTIDLYYLHNPESGMEGLSTDEFERRIRGAFEALEVAVTEGKIANYGTATWHGYRKPPGVTPHHSLERFVAIAREVGGDHHHFRFVQLPYNLAFIEAFATPTQPLSGKLVPLLQAAASLGLTVMASAPLLQGQLVERLPDHVRIALGDGTDAQRAVQFARSTPGITTALVGMKSVIHVEQIAEVARSPKVAAETIRELFKE